MNGRLVRALCAVLVGVLAASIAGCGGSDSEATGANGATRVTVSVGSDSLANALTLLAVDRGFFQQEGIDANFVTAETGTVALTALIRNDTQVLQTGPGPALTANAQGRDMRFLVNGYAGPILSVVLRRDVAERLNLAADAPVEQRLRALDGLRLATATPVATFTTFVRRATQNVGATPVFIYIEQPTMVAALDRGVVDGFVASPPFTNQAVIANNAVLWLSGPDGDFSSVAGPQYTSVPVFVTERWLDDNPDTAARVVAAYLRTAAFVRNSPDQAEQALRQRFEGIDNAVFDAAWQQHREAFTRPALTPQSIQPAIDTLEGEGLPAGAREQDPVPMIATQTYDAGCQRVPDICQQLRQP